MKDYLKALIRRHDPLRARNVVREYLQARVLLAMQGAGAMTTLAFQGGTCLRFLYSLPRYSEDLDFALEGNREAYDLPKYLKAVRADLGAENYRVELRIREHRAVHGAMARFPGLLHELGLSPHRSEALAIRIEVDTNPPPGADCEISLVRRHVTLRLFHHDRASLLAGKLHAVLQRGYAKGRDLYDLIWYLSDPDWPAPNLSLLNAALRQTGWTRAELTTSTWTEPVVERLKALDWEQALADVRPFLEEQNDIDLTTSENALRLLATSGSTGSRSL